MEGLSSLGTLEDQTWVAHEKHECLLEILYRQTCSYPYKLLINLRDKSQNDKRDQGITGIGTILKDLTT